MKLSNLKRAVYSIIVILTSSVIHASEHKEGAEDKKFDAKEMIMHHVKDAHAFHLFDWNGEPVALELPIILYNNGLTTFSSGKTTSFLWSPLAHDNMAWDDCIP